MDVTLAQIILRAIHLLDEDPEDVEEFHDLFMAYANEGYRIAVTQYVKPRRSYVLRTDSQGRAPIAFADITRMVCVKNAQGRDVWFDIDADGEQLITAERDGEVTALCETACPDMERDDDVPRIPPSLHAALADYICYRYLSSGNLARQSRAQVWSANFYRAMQAARPQGFGSVTRLRNLYAVTDARYRG